MEENSTSAESVVMNRITKPETPSDSLDSWVLMKEDTYNE
jgi:hypothetical protein